MRAFELRALFNKGGKANSITILTRKGIKREKRKYPKHIAEDTGEVALGIQTKFPCCSISLKVFKRSSIVTRRYIVECAFSN